MSVTFLHLQIYMCARARVCVCVCGGGLTFYTGSTENLWKYYKFTTHEQFETGYDIQITCTWDTNNEFTYRISFVWNKLCIRYVTLYKIILLFKYNLEFNRV
jgi:hypothetical protein